MLSSIGNGSTQYINHAHRIPNGVRQLRTALRHLMVGSSPEQTSRALKIKLVLSLVVIQIRQRNLPRVLMGTVSDAPPSLQMNYLIVVLLLIRMMLILLIVSRALPRTLGMPANQYPSLSSMVVVLVKSKRYLNALRLGAMKSQIPTINSTQA